MLSYEAEAENITVGNVIEKIASVVQAPVSITEIVAKRLKLFSKRRVVNLLDGNYDSIFKGKGVEFPEST